MSWSLLSFALPAFGLLKVFAQSNPASYKKFDDMPQSDQAAAINAILERVLNAENVQGSEHFERTEDMLKELPDSAGPKTIQSLLRYRLKVVKTETDDFPVFATGTDAQAGKYYIGVKPDPEVEPSLPWVVTHELSHILNDDQLTLGIAKTIASLGMAALSTFVLGWSLLPSLGAVIVTNCVTHTVCSQRAERAADDFAIKHCSREQLEKGIAFFELIKARRASGTYTNNLITCILHPSENSRIAKIRAALGLAGKAKLA
ncbi:MAG: M48 family metalloprotease [Candidatus Obscuribacterales bacterium]|nr:M48 family metalloprotease [Candidatus Obscuribacterales bacterium]